MQLIDMTLDDLRERYRNTIMNLQRDTHKLSPISRAAFDPEMMVERSEKLAKAMFDIIVLRQHVRRRFASSSFNRTTGDRMRHDVRDFLWEMKEDQELLKNISMLWSENVRMLRSLTSGMQSPI